MQLTELRLKPSVPRCKPKKVPIAPQEPSWRLVEGWQPSFKGENLTLCPRTVLHGGVGASCWEALPKSDEPEWVLNHEDLKLIDKGIRSAREEPLISYEDLLRTSGMS